MILDGREVPVPPGASILGTARTAGTTIPALCHHPALTPDGSCRMCLVEIDGHPGLHPACTIPAHDDLVVRTESPPVQAARRHVLRLLLAGYRAGRGKAHNELPALATRYGVPAPPVGLGRASCVDESNPFIRVDHGACIRCWRCVRACDRLNGVTAIGIFGRGRARFTPFTYQPAAEVPDADYPLVLTTGGCSSTITLAR